MLNRIMSDTAEKRSDTIKNIVFPCVARAAAVSVIVMRSV